MSRKTINELMGKGGEKAKGRKLTLDDLHELLGERMPKIEATPVGRLRLTSALRNRFGDGYRNLPGIEDILKDFEEEARFNVKLQEMKLIRAKRERK